MAHFAPGLLKGDVYVVYVNGRLQLKGVPFKTVSDYLKVKPGKFKVEVREAGEPANSPPVVAATVELEAGKAYTVAVFGQLTSVQAALLTDDMSRPANSKSKVRLIQAIPGESAVDLVDGGDVLISNAKFPSASDYQEVPAGSADLEVRKTGSGEVLAKAEQRQADQRLHLVAGGGGRHRREGRAARHQRRGLGGVRRRRGRHRGRRDRPQPQPGRAPVRPAPADRLRPCRRHRVRRAAAAVERLGTAGMS